MSTAGSHAVPPWMPDEGSQNALRDNKTTYRDGNLALVVGAGVTMNSLAVPPWMPDEGSQNALRDIKTAYRDGNLVLVVGAGVTMNSLASSQKQVPQDVKDRLTWPGLLRHGLAYVKEVKGDLNHLSFLEKKRFNSYESALQDNTSDLTTDDLIDIAGLFKKSLGQDQLPNWLERCFRRLYPDYIQGETIGVLQAIQALRFGGARIMTTNYDDTIERFCGTRAVLPQNDIDMAEFVHGGQDGDIPGVLHVHGHWKDARNAVLDVVDYHQTTSDEPLQEVLQQMFNSTEVLIFVGTGDGLNDPNFGGLLRWAKEKLQNQANRHFVLMKDGDTSTNRAVVSPVFYGRQHSDLAPFLQAIADSKVVYEGP